MVLSLSIWVDICMSWQQLKVIIDWQLVDWEVISALLITVQLVAPVKLSIEIANSQQILFHNICFSLYSVNNVYQNVRIFW